STPHQFIWKARCKIQVGWEHQQDIAVMAKLREGPSWWEHPLPQSLRYLSCPDHSACGYREVLLIDDPYSDEQDNAAAAEKKPLDRLYGKGTSQ
ncbi:hypothetical protein BGW42_001580, partial [Actinomortierella wolfii]